MQNMLKNGAILSQAAINDLLRAERIALKYSPGFALVLAKIYWQRVNQ